PWPLGRFAGNHVRPLLNRSRWNQPRARTDPPARDVVLVRASQPLGFTADALCDRGAFVGAVPGAFHCKHEMPDGPAVAGRIRRVVADYSFSPGWMTTPGRRSAAAIAAPTMPALLSSWAGRTGVCRSSSGSHRS